MELYEIPSKLRAAFDKIEVDEKTGELFNTEELNAVEAEAAEKIAAAGFYLDELEAEISELKLAIERMVGRKNAIVKRQKRIREYVTTALVHIGGKVKTPAISMWIRRNTSAVVDDIEKLPAQFKTEEVTRTTKVLSDLLKKELEKNPVEGAHLKESVSLMVR